MNAPLITVGQLARRAGLRPSALRFYEAEGLLAPTAHSETGYRLYDTAAEQTLQFIVRAQRLGFSLADIRGLLAARRAGEGDETLLAVAEARYLALERQLTPLLVLRHELTHLLQDLRGEAAEAARPRLDRLLDRVCADPLRQPAEDALARLLELASCTLSSEEGRALLAGLRGQHVHLWHEGEGYHILVVSDDPEVGAALERLRALEAGCAAHPGAELALALRHTDEGYLLVAGGADAFLYARLFMALEGQEDAVA
jgi:MerR family copper efflux transcriptional regulator